MGSLLTALRGGANPLVIERTGVDPSDGFSEMFRAIARSGAYADAVRASANGLPDWVVPFSPIYASLLERIAGELRVSEGEWFLDIACGAGGPGLWVAERMRADLIGLDFAPAAIELARQRAERRGMSARARFLVADATATGLLDASVAAVMSIDALMFIEPAAIAAELARVIRPHGRLVFTAAESLVEPFIPTLVRDYRPIFEAAGFSTILHEEPVERERHSLALYRALMDRAEALRTELGEVAESLIEEATNGLERAEHNSRRVREIFFVAQRNS